LELLKMHVLQPKQTRLSKEEADKLLKQYNISLTQLPKLKITDVSIPENCEIGEVIKIERESHGKKTIYYRVVVV